MRKFKSYEELDHEINRKASALRDYVLFFVVASGLLAVGYYVVINWRG